MLEIRAENTVEVRIITADTEGAVVENIERKERQFHEMRGMIAVTQNIRRIIFGATALETVQSTENSDIARMAKIVSSIRRETK